MDITNGNFIIHNDFKYYKKILSERGGTMSVYYDKLIKNNEKVAVKIDKIKKKLSSVLNEIFTLEKLKTIK